MADEERERPSLELPSLGFGRKRKQRQPMPEPSPAPRVEQAHTPPAAPASPPEPEPAPVVDQPGEPEPARVVDQPGEPSTRRQFTLPPINAMAASVVTGLLVGLVGTGLVWGSTRLCELVRGTSSCGKPGFLLLLAVVVIAVLLGRYLLQALGVAEPLSTSVLGVAATTALTLLFLDGQLFEWWMVIALPLVAAAGYAGAHAVTTAVVDPIEDNLHR